ncbi:MAG: Mannose-6-phosphate isomerase / glucose-6-phosphate isomerase, partial [candidate division WS6 bacterium GW2011_GWA2_37_6]
MLNTKYYKDIKNFPGQFAASFKASASLKLKGKYNKFTVCGMGGSSLYVELISDYLRSQGYKDISISHCRSYNLPQYSDNKTLYIVASYSGNTEETISCLEEIRAKKYKFVILTSGGKLLEFAKKYKAPVYLVPTGGQPRLATGYFIAAVLTIMSKVSTFKLKVKEIENMTKNMEKNLDEKATKRLAKELIGKVPIIYSTDINRSIAKISKIKFNENSKIQSFWNYFPELNHNEMVGFTKLLMQPYFIIYQSKFTHPRNIRRIEVFKKLMEEKGM